MKLFKTLSALAVVRAQVPDFSDLNALFASLTDSLAVAPAAAGEAAAPAAADGARYVVASTTTTPPLTTTTVPETPPIVSTSGTGCWKCDAMDFASCATGGSWTQCSPDQSNGDFGVCFLELREQNQLLTQLCTGCKDRNSCYNLRRQNFVGSNQSARMGRFHDQCKPEWKLQRGSRRYGVQQSVCRTCFNMCDTTDDHKCFGGLEATGEANGEFFKYDIATNTASSTGATKTYWYTNAQAAVIDTMSLGIPLGVFSTHATSDAEVAAHTNMVNWGGAHTDSGSGKKYLLADGRTIAQADMGLYWGIQDQSKTWWSYDHAIVQNAYQASADDSLIARLNAASEFTGLTELI